MRGSIVTANTAGDDRLAAAHGFERRRGKRRGGLLAGVVHRCPIANGRALRSDEPPREGENPAGWCSRFGAMRVHDVAVSPVGDTAAAGKGDRLTRVAVD